MSTREPYLELTCTDCGELYTPDQFDCPRCGSANVSYNAQAAAEYQEWHQDRRYERDDGAGW